MGALDELRAQVPVMKCFEGCSDCCGLAFFTAEERERILAIGGVERDQPALMDCRYLDGDRCSIYSERPLICRLFGAAEALPCPYGAKPDGPMLADFDRIMAEYRAKVGDDKYSTLGGEFVAPTDKQG